MSTGIEILLREKIERTIFSPVSDEEFDREILWLSEVRNYHDLGGIGKGYIEKRISKDSPQKYTSFCILKQVGLITEEGDNYRLTDEGLRVHSSLVKEGVYGRFASLVLP
ncbi:Uncharacterised protein [uncultured archaeon]|nr:Uncharacterised protein [uncultured archaeon]